jgi:hypothetical protein
MSEGHKYAECDACGQVMGPATGCTLAHLSIDGQEFARLPFGTEQGFVDDAFERACHDCNVVVPQLHHPHCDMEQCPGCGGQLLSCDCEVEDFAVAQ